MPDFIQTPSDRSGCPIFKDDISIFTHCETCGGILPKFLLATKRCINCWVIEHRLPEYLKHPKGLAFVRKHMPLLDDFCDWDYEAVLKENDVKVEWCNEAIDCNDNIHKLPQNDSFRVLGALMLAAGCKGYMDWWIL